jgi:hypothetical protein
VSAASASASASPAVDQPSYGLASRPEVDPVVLAVLAAAVDQVWPRPGMVVAEEPTGGPAWRFSGRWWARPTAQRRERPWTTR